jgi:putative ABC transport system ATP-binding protein
MIKTNFLNGVLEKITLPELEMGSDEPLVQLSGVVKTYPTVTGSFTALKNININFYPGEFVGILGKSGAGKTTLVNLITGIDHLTAGKVCIGGVSIHELSENQASLWRGRNLGIVYQTFRLMPTLSLVDNIMLPIDLCGNYNRQTSYERALELLNSVELQDHAYKLPNAISGGQQQRVAIARALANDPPIIIADEPTGRLDSATSDIVYKIFVNLAKQGKLIIMATHDLSVIKQLSRRIELVDGEIKSDSRQTGDQP